MRCRLRPASLLPPLAGLLALVLLGVVPVAGAAESKPPFTVASLKLIPKAGDNAGNYAKFEQFARQAAAAGARLLVTSECYLDGYLGNTKRNPGTTRESFLAAAETIDGPHVRKAAALAKELSVYLVFNFSERRGDRAYTTAAFITPEGRIAGTYSKSHIEATELYSPGTEFPVFDTALGKIGLLICYDRQLPETSRVLALQGAEIIVVPAHSEQVDLINEDLLMRVRAYENNVFTVFHSPFNSLAADPAGEVIAHSNGRLEEGIVYARIDLARRNPEGGPIGRRHPELYHRLLEPAAAPK